MPDLLIARANLLNTVSTVSAASIAIRLANMDPALLHGLRALRENGISYRLIRGEHNIAATDEKWIDLFLRVDEHGAVLYRISGGTVLNG